MFFIHEKQEPTGTYFARIEQFTRRWDGTNEITGAKIRDPMILYDNEILTKI